MAQTIDLQPVIEHGRVIYATCPPQVALCRSPIPALLILAMLVTVLSALCLCSPSSQNALT